MRISIKEDSATARYARAWLNDEEVSTRCFAADDVEGWVDCYVLNEKGQWIYDKERDETKQERLYGNVKIVIKKPEPPSDVTVARNDSGAAIVNWSPKVCDNFCEQCGDCLDCYSDAHEDGCSNI